MTTTEVQATYRVIATRLKVGDVLAISAREDHHVYIGTVESIEERPAGHLRVVVIYRYPVTGATGRIPLVLQPTEYVTKL